MSCTDIDILEELGPNSEYWLLLILLTLSQEEEQDGDQDTNQAIR